uniref:Uncharacterized protein n=1 Tax=Chromera velia CCMP2878 TaxID=1169474 RepID=A0A0G4HVZ0_9ALVE|eukprot:Cvel_32384.t1-p1 / transcript=Cvel_32384.t1 / gene=Cvel_32384 / organism=Chromera_velia_CCMP2878 / gene_product=hypothetical protein / transcript_product=hypothetical protein / location=Cvel_scaffold5032:3503-6265(-) / protein_length=341 / sequence_SO=supercontig / SO=protein_coding / is_pseudo=false
MTKINDYPNDGKCAIIINPCSLMPPDKDPPPPNWRFPTQREFRSAPYLPPPVGQYSPSDAVTTRDCTQGGGVRDFDGVAKRGNLWGSSEEEPIRYALDDRKLHASLGKQILSPKGRGFHDSSGGEILRVQPPYTERGGARGMIYGKALMKATDIQDRSARAQVENPETLAVGLCKSAGALGELCDEPSAKAQKVKNSLGEWTVKLLDGCIPVLPVEPPREALPSPSFPPHVLAIADLSPKSQQGGNKSHVVLLPPPSPSERRALTASQEERPGSRSERGHGMGGESRGEEQGMPSSGSIVVPSDMEREKCLAADVRGEQEREARLYLKEVEKLRRQILLGR